MTLTTIKFDPQTISDNVKHHADLSTCAPITVCPKSTNWGTTVALCCKKMLRHKPLACGIWTWWSKIYTALSIL